MEETKRVQFSIVYDIPVRYTHVAFNREGVLSGFINPPERVLDAIEFDNKQGKYVKREGGEWYDEKNKEKAPYGETILFDTPDGKGWDTSVREVAVLKDTRRYATGIRRKKKKMAETIKRRKEQS